MGDPKAPDPLESAGKAYEAYSRYLPQILYTQRENILPSTLANIQAAEAVAGRQGTLDDLYAQQQAQRYLNYAPIYALASAATERDVLQGPGGESVRAADLLTREIDPEYYATRAANADKLNALLSGMDPNALTNAEMSNVERGLARSNIRRGINDVPMSSGALRAGMTYGSALDAKRQNVMNAINTATQFLPQSRSGVDVFGQATGRQGTQALGSWGTFNPSAGQGVNQAGNQVGNQAGNIWNTMGGFQTNAMNINANRRDALDRLMEVSNTFSNAVGAAGSII